MLTEILSVAMLTGMGKVASPQDLVTLFKGFNTFNSAAISAIRNPAASITNFNPTSGIAELSETVENAVDGINNAISAAFRVYQNVGRALGPLAVWDMPVANQLDRRQGDPANPLFSDETIYGGVPSMFLTPPPNEEQPQNRLPTPFGLMVQQPLLTRNPAPNPQPPVPAGLGVDPADAASGYSLDLRSLVAQALYDPGVLPPKPDTNVSLTPIYELNANGN